MAIRFFQVFAVSTAFTIHGVLGQAPFIGGMSGSHTDLDRWCGKPYEAGSPNFNPGGQYEASKPSDDLLLDVRVQPKHSIYDSSESTGHFIVDNPISLTHGQPFSGVCSLPPQNSSVWHASPCQKLSLQIFADGIDSPLVVDQVDVNTTGNVLRFDLKQLAPQLEPYNITLTASLLESQKVYKYFATAELYCLPAKNSGSTVKIDNLHGGLLVANNATNYEFEPLFPFGFYTSCSGYLNYSLTNVTAYKNFGFNAINPVCAFTDGDLDFLYDWMDSVNLWYQYDMRGSYTNLTSISEQIPLLKDRSNLLTWYTADEPDGWQYALNSTRLAYDLLKQRDPYHPTALVLNCQNYYYKEYANGADVIMEDAYPVGIDPTYSRKFDTPVNTTYGDAGCDNCIGSLSDVSDRLDTLIQYQQGLNEPGKPLWAVLQAFSGEEYWSRDPTPEESWVMMILAFNHVAKAIMSWTFPASSILEAAHGEMAKVATSPEISRFLLGDTPRTIQVASQPLLDVAQWEIGEQIMVAVANVGNSSTGSISIPLQRHIEGIKSQPWGSVSWSLHNGSLEATDIPGVATSILLLE